MTGNIGGNKRVILITTGATGGTGLNLGAFDGVIHYELPFTSIELEQRFGRVDRMDVESKNKDMIFLLHEDSNPMLRFPTLKINATARYMPIRNTVLFYPEVIEIIRDSLQTEFDACKSTAEERALLKQWGSLREACDPTQAQPMERFLLREKQLDCYPLDDSESAEKYGEFLSQLNGFGKNTLLELYKKKKTLLYLLVEVGNWDSLLGQKMENTPKEDHSLQAFREEEFAEYEETSGDCLQTDGVIIAGEVSNVLSFEEVLRSEVETIIERTLGHFEKEKVRSSTGLFYIKDNRYTRQTVKEYRGEHS